MDYLFFDIECANCEEGRGKICSLGYVITNEHFEIIKQEEIKINPRSFFDFYVRKKVLMCNPKEYEQYDDFGKKYDYIKSLLTEKDRLVFGYGVLVDMEYILSECIRYDRPLIDYSAFDVQLIYKDVYKVETGLKLGDVVKSMSLGDELTAHNGLDDAVATMLILKKISGEPGFKLNDYLDKVKIQNDGKVITKTFWKIILTKMRNLSELVKSKNVICIDELYEIKKPMSAVKLYYYMFCNGIKADFYGGSCTIYLEYMHNGHDRPKEKKFRKGKIKKTAEVHSVNEFIEENGIDVDSCTIAEAQEYLEFLKDVK